MDYTIRDYMRDTLDNLPDAETQTVVENIIIAVAQDLADAIKEASEVQGGDVDYDATVGVFMNTFFMRLHSDEELT